MAAQVRRLQTTYAYLMLVLCMLIWSGNLVFGRAARDDISPVALGFWRWTIAACIMAPFALPALKGHARLLRNHIGLILALALFGSALFHITLYYSVHYTEAINATLMNSGAPIFFIALAWLIDGTRPTQRQIAGMLISLAGIVVIVTRGDAAQLFHLRFNIGDLIVFFANIFWGLYSVLIRRAPKALETTAFLFVVTVVGVIMALPVYLLDLAFGAQASQLTAISVGAVLYTAIFPSVVAYIFWAKGIAEFGPGKASLFFPLLPVFGTVLSIVALGESFQTYHAIGLIVTLVGVWLATSASRRAFAAPD